MSSTRAASSSAPIIGKAEANGCQGFSPLRRRSSGCVVSVAGDTVGAVVAAASTDVPVLTSPAIGMILLRLRVVGFAVLGACARLGVVIGNHLPVLVEAPTLLAGGGRFRFYGVAFVRVAIQSCTSRSRQATRPRRSFTGSGNWPFRRRSCTVVRDRVVRSRTTGHLSSLSGMSDVVSNGRLRRIRPCRMHNNEVVVASSVDAGAQGAQG